MKTRLKLNWFFLMVLGALSLQPAAQAYYDPSTQRWVNRDPVDELGGINLYAFGVNNPLGFFDAFGLTGWQFTDACGKPLPMPKYAGPSKDDCFVACALAVATGAASVGIGVTIGTIGTGVFGTVVFGYGLCAMLCGI